MLDQIDTRIETYSLLINSNPCDADTYNYLGRAYCEKGEFERACGQKLPVTLKWCEAGVISAGSTARSLGADPLKNGFTPSKETSRCRFLTLTTLRP